MDDVTHTTLITQYQDGYRVIIEALDGISDRELDACEARGEWPPREVVHLLADSEMTSALRLRRLLIEDQPEIQNYDQDAYARQLWYDRPIEASLAAFRAARETTGELLVRMNDDDWTRAGIHSESGRYGASDWLEIYAVHAHDHADQIRRARATVR